MGMAASQARFLQLTARKTNIEYMGQQINQQRLALANASAGLFEKMLSMVPPTPPSSQDDKYFTQGYKFTDSADDVQKSVSWESIVAGDATTSVLNTDFKTTAVPPVTIGAFNFVGTTGAAASTFTVTNTQMAAAANGTQLAGQPTVADIAKALGTGPTDDQKAIGYTSVIRNITVEHNIYNPDGQYTTVKVQTPALMNFDNLNRLINFTVLNKANQNADVSATTGGSVLSADKPVIIGNGEDLTYGGKFDDTAYNNDMNKYEFQKSTYDYEVERINQSTKQIQSQDKSLELKMKQLDTEHNAVQTEMEAVQKVLQKNIEGSFKTFA